MAVKKQEVTTAQKVECECKGELKRFLGEKMPAMFDRTPDITGDLDKFADEIIKIVK